MSTAVGVEFTHHGRSLPTSLRLNDRQLSNSEHKFTVWFFYPEDRAGRRAKCYVLRNFFQVLILRVTLRFQEVRGGSDSSPVWARVWWFGNSRLEVTVLWPCTVTERTALLPPCLALLACEEEETAEFEGGKPCLIELSQKVLQGKKEPRIFSDKFRWEVNKENVEVYKTS